MTNNATLHPTTSQTLVYAEEVLGYFEDTYYYDPDHLIEAQDRVTSLIDDLDEDARLSMFVNEHLVIDAAVMMTAAFILTYRVENVGPI